MIDYTLVLFLGISNTAYNYRNNILEDFIDKNKFKVVLTCKERGSNESKNLHNLPYYKEWRVGSCISGFKGQEVLEFVNKYKILDYLIFDYDVNYFPTQPLIRIDKKMGLRKKDLALASDYISCSNWYQRQEILKSQFYEPYLKDNYKDIYTPYGENS